MRTTALSLTAADIHRVRTAPKGPTFRPMAHSRYKCNQLPELGPLTRTQVQFVRAVCARDPSAAERDYDVRRFQRRLETVSTPTFSVSEPRRTGFFPFGRPAGLR